MVRVKICGISDPASALAAAEAGTHAIGMIFAPSRRQVTVARAREIAAALPPFVTKVGVFVNEERPRILEIVDACRLDMLQLHGDESPEFAAAFGLPVIKAIRVRDARSLEAMAQYRVAAFLLDSYDPDVAGGSGKAFTWELGADARPGAPVLLSGGLTPDNVQQALDVVRPYGVDVSSGVETDGRKDHAKIRAFIARVREWDHQR